MSKFAIIRVRIYFGLLFLYLILNELSAPRGHPGPTETDRLVSALCLLVFAIIVNATISFLAGGSQSSKPTKQVRRPAK